MDSRQDVVQFFQDMQNRFEKFCGEYNGTGGFEKKSWDSPVGKIDAVFSRGAVFEKASAVYCDLEIDTPPVLAQKLGTGFPRMGALVLEINIFPENPHIPKGYIELRANIVGSKIILAGGTDIFPYFHDSDARDMFAAGICGVCKHHHQDYIALRKVRADFFKSKYTKDDVGSHAGIYFFYLEAEHSAFFKDMAEAFFKGYGDLVAQKKNIPVTDQDRQHRLKCHGRWAQWILLEDEGTKFGLDKGIPPEALLGAILPPAAIF